MELNPIFNHPLDEAKQGRLARFDRQFVRPGYQVRVIAGWTPEGPDTGWGGAWRRGQFVNAVITKVNRVCLSF